MPRCLRRAKMLALWHRTGGALWHRAGGACRLRMDERHRNIRNAGGQMDATAPVSHRTRKPPHRKGKVWPALVLGGGAMEGASTSTGAHKTLANASPAPGANAGPAPRAGRQV